MQTWLVTGGTGFLGRHVLEAAKGVGRVVALGRRGPEGCAVEDFVRADLDDREGLARAVAEVAPEVVIHAAGRTPPGDDLSYYHGNTRATFHLLDALSRRRRAARVVLVGSAAELGKAGAEGLPIGEDCPCRPLDAYGRSKWAAGRLGRTWPKPLEVVVGRVFNPIGPGTPTSQALGRFAAELARPGLDPLHLTVGDLDARRDFIDARDVAQALVALAKGGRAGEVYHVGTGRSHRVGEGLERLIALSGREVVVEVRADRHVRLGPGDSRADIRKIVERTGWAPRIGWEQSLADLWDDARSRADRAGRARHVA